jgi:hypothetical protein
MDDRILSDPAHAPDNTYYENENERDNSEKNSGNQTIAHEEYHIPIRVRFEYYQQDDRQGYDTYQPPPGIHARGQFIPRYELQFSLTRGRAGGLRRSPAGNYSAKILREPI